MSTFRTRSIVEGKPRTVNKLSLVLKGNEFRKRRFCEIADEMAILRQRSRNRIAAATSSETGNRPYFASLTWKSECLRPPVDGERDETTKGATSDSMPRAGTSNTNRALPLLEMSGSNLADHS